MRFKKRMFYASFTFSCVESVEILLPMTIRRIQFSGFREEVEICPSQSESRAAILVFLIEDVEILLPVMFRWIPLSSSGKSRKCLSHSNVIAVILVFRSTRKKKHNLVEEDKLLLPVKFCRISFSGLGEVDNGKLRTTYHGLGAFKTS